MKKTAGNLMLLSNLFCVALIISNIVATKLFDTGLYLFGSRLVLTCGIICYPITFLVVDVIGEIWGKAEAGKVVRSGMYSQVLVTAIIIAARYMPTNDPVMQDAYVTFMSQNTMLVVGSLTAYLFSQLLDVWVFHKVRTNYLEKGGTRRARWLWTTVSTFTGQLLDTAIFMGVAFGLGQGWLFKPEMLVTLALLIGGQYAGKCALALSVTPLFYLLTRQPKEQSLAP